jgi:hypothetical protein
MCKRNARQTPEGPPVRCHTGLPIQFLYSLRFDALSIAFRVAGFGRADLTLFPEMSPVTCEGDTTLMLASCKEFMQRIIRLDLVVCESCFAGV